MDEASYRYIVNRQRRIPGQIRAARQKLRQLLMEAETLGLGPSIIDHEYNGSIAAMQADKAAGETKEAGRC